MPDFFQSQLDAYQLASRVAASAEPITEVWIRQIHEVLTGPQATYDVRTPSGWMQAPLPKGIYKQNPNHVTQSDGTTHAFAPVDRTPDEMHRLVDELNSGSFAASHPVLQASYCHYCLTAIHPFADGNGRVARAVSSVFLRRAGRIPLLIWVDQRPRYFACLRSADLGERQTFVDFVFDCSIDAFQFVRNELGPRPEDALPQLAKLHLSHLGLPYTELDRIAASLASLILTETNSVISGTVFPTGVTVRAGMASTGRASTIDSYRPAGASASQTEVFLIFQSDPPAQAQTQVPCRVLIARDDRARYAFVIESAEHSGPLEVRLSDVYPIHTPSATRQVHSWVKRVIGEGLARLLAQAEASLRNPQG
jgi:hypothetical protein